MEQNKKLIISNKLACVLCGSGEPDEDDFPFIVKDDNLHLTMCRVCGRCVRRMGYEKAMRLLPSLIPRKGLLSWSDVQPRLERLRKFVR